MAQIIPVTAVQDPMMNGLARKEAEAMERGTAPFRRALATDKGTIIFQKLGNQIRALVSVAGGTQHVCAVGTFLKNFIVRIYNGIGDQMLSKAGSIPGFDVWTQVKAAASSSTLSRSETYAVSTRTPSCIVAQHGGHENILFILDGVLWFIGFSQIYPFKSVVPVHVPSFGIYPAAFYQEAVFPPSPVTTKLLYPVAIIDPKRIKPTTYEVRALSLQSGFKQTAASASDPTIDPNYGTELIQLTGGLSGVVNPDGSVYAVYFKNVYSGQQDFNRTGMRISDKLTSTLYIAGANIDQAFNNATGLVYALQMIRFITDANTQLTACTAVASSDTKKALFHFFHWVYTDQRPQGGNPPLTTAQLFFTTVKPDKSLVTKRLWKITNGVAELIDPSFSSWMDLSVDMSAAPGFMIQEPAPLTDGHGTGKVVAALENNGIVTIATNFLPHYNSGLNPNGVFVYNMDSDIASVTDRDYVVFYDANPEVAAFSGGSAVVTDFQAGKVEATTYVDTTKTVRPGEHPEIEIEYKINVIDTTIPDLTNPPTRKPAEINGSIFVGKNTINTTYSPPKHGGATVPLLAP